MKILSKMTDKKWLIALIAAGIAVAAAAISLIIYFGRKDDEGIEDDYFAE